MTSPKSTTDKRPVKPVPRKTRRAANPLVKAEGDLRDFGMSFPEATEDFPWGHRALKVKGKAFCFLALEEGTLSLSVKLPQSNDAARMLPFASPTGYGLGKAGWISAAFEQGDTIPLDLLHAWLRESYRAIAPKRLGALLTDTAAAKKTPVGKTPSTRQAARKPAPSNSVTDLDTIFARIRQLAAKYAPPYTVTIDRPGRYELWSQKDLVIEGRKRKEVFFLGLIIQKGYVGFYFMPVYAKPEMQQVFAPELLKLLKGKSCFHIKALDAALEKQIKAALAAGHKLYRERGWVPVGRRTPDVGRR